MKKQLILIGLAAILVLGGCGNANDGTNNGANNGADNGTNNGDNNDANNGGNDEHADMNHSTSGEIPEGLKESSNPTFPVGSQAVIQADHMSGMNGATTTIAGAFDTTVYTVSYTPTTGGEKVTDHKWVIHEEIQDAGETPYNSGTEVVLEADHMKGMEGATATIDSAEQTTVYMVDYIPTTGGEPVQNHKWVTERELTSP